MRTGQLGGLCSACGRERDDGLYWRSVAVVLDFGVETMPPMEPAMEPVRCDDCESAIHARDVDELMALLRAGRTDR